MNMDTTAMCRSLSFSQMWSLYLLLLIASQAIWTVAEKSSTQEENNRTMLDIGIGIGIGGGGGGGSGGEEENLDPTCFDNARLFQAYIGLQTWKKAITKDPQGILKTWVGSHVCNYTGVFCAPPRDNSVKTVVAGIDLNHATLTGTLVEELGLLTDIAIFHINTNSFSGTLPEGLGNLFQLSELDVSNNGLSGFFPTVVLTLQNLIYLDLRFNKFYGVIPAELFTRNLDAIFLNDNYFEKEIPENLGSSPASVLNFANNKLSGSIPASLCNMAGTLNEVMFLNNGISGCLPDQIGILSMVTVFDVSFNKMGGQIPFTLGCMKSLEQLNLAHNQFYGLIPDVICSISSLRNFTVSYNYLSGDGPSCICLTERGIAFDDSHNCISYRPWQRSISECAAFARGPKTCPAIPAASEIQCALPPAISPSTP